MATTDTQAQNLIIFPVQPNEPPCNSIVLSSRDYFSESPCPTEKERHNAPMHVRACVRLCFGVWNIPFPFMYKVFLSLYSTPGVHFERASVSF